MFGNDVKFKYTWRPYQKRVLDNASKYLQDGKINIVAAPGSGKTVLGLELVRRIDKPVLILAPTVTIKNQWVDRFVSLFMETKNIPDYISTDIYNLKKFNVITYQALHFAYKKRVLKEENLEDTDDEEIEKEEKIDEKIVKSYDLTKHLKENNISVVVLDEAHHLKSEWWKSLTEVISKLNNVSLISLTATPPYDVEYSEFKKYTDLCGDIDETISVPELVAANNLCPHQDYIYFNMPTEEEMAYIKEYEINLNEIIEKIKQNEEFKEAIRAHKYITSPYLYEEELLENVEYYSSMLIFLNYKNVEISKDNLKILGTNKKIPELSLEWLEILLKNVIITDRANYVDYEECISSVEKQLNKIGAIEKKELSFSNSKTLKNYFVNSLGKLDSISKVVGIESSNLKEKLRMVILTDYIRKEYLEQEEVQVNKLGVLPIFITLRRSHPDINMAILTGSMFVIPKVAEKNLFGLCNAHNVDTKKLSFEELKIDPNYSVVKVPDSLKNKIMSFISKLFASGILNIIIGTKSLLGEGWDEPSINCLILASFVGSYMLSNQMRGRAIRVNNDPRKTANIWHLVCTFEETNKDNECIENSDYNMLKRRFNAFTGIGFSKNVIRSGIDRLGVYPPFNKEKIDNINQNMAISSSKRDEMYDRWKNAIDMSNISNSKITEKIEMEEEKGIKKAWFVDNKFIFLVIIFSMIILGILFGILKLGFLTILIELVLGICILVKFKKIKRLSNSENSIKELGKVVLNSLYRCKYITTGISKIKVVTKKSDEIGKIECYITGATEKENNLFVTSMQEVFAKTINQRYIIVRLNSKLEEIDDYYNVPTLLDKNKEMAEVFKTYFEAKIGKCDLLYTRSAQGRKILLKARMKGLGYKDRLTKKEEYIHYK